MLKKHKETDEINFNNIFHSIFQNIIISSWNQYKNIINETFYFFSHTKSPRPSTSQLGLATFQVGHSHSG